MFVVFFLFLTSFACLLVSLLALGIVLKYSYSRGDDELKTTRDDAILITGCDSGIGLELAKYFDRTTNYKIICCFLNSLDSNGHAELKDRASRSDRLILTDLNITSADDISKIVKLVEKLQQDKQFNNLVALINNAGTMVYGEFDWLTPDHIQRQIDVNLVGTINLTRAIYPFIIQSKGRIINVSSVNDATVFPGLSIYSATKSALSTFSRGIGYELRKFGAHVVTVRLGDFARLTNIMAGHARHREDMWNDMDTNKRDLYKNYFDEFNDHLMKNYGMTSPREYGDSSLFLDFRRALLAKNPPTTITCAPIGFRIFYFVIELIPVWIQYYLLDFLMQFGFKWKAPQVDSFSQTTP